MDSMAERIEAKQAIDREDRGVFLCPNCGHETTTMARCGHAPCGLAGCPECMSFIEQDYHYFCSPECIKKRVINRMQMRLLDHQDLACLNEAESLLRDTVSRLKEIDSMNP